MTSQDLADRILAELINLGYLRADPGTVQGAKATIDDLCAKASPPRHGRRGSGAHYAKEMTRLARMHQDVIDALEYRGAYSWENGLKLSELTIQVNYLREHPLDPLEKPRRNIKDSTVTGRASELQGLGITSCEPSEIELRDRDTMEFRDKVESRWYLTSQRPLLEVKR